MEYGLFSTVFHFIPNLPNGQLMIFHDGHGGDIFTFQMPFIEAALQRGFSVAAFEMPLSPDNGFAMMVDVPGYGEWRMFYHDQIQYLRPAQGHPIRYFLEPVIVFLNYADDLGYTHIAMAGISGGGWTTTIAAAIDSRIQSSYPVAGSFPLRLYNGLGTIWGDWEQTTYDVYSIADYPEWYIVGACNGKQIQVLNFYDPCCFGGAGYLTYYEDTKNRAAVMGCSWDLFSDDTHHEHKISEAARAVIFGDLEKYGGIWSYYYPVVRK